MSSVACGGGLGLKKLGPEEKQRGQESKGGREGRKRELNLSELTG